MAALSGSLVVTTVFFGCIGLDVTTTILNRIRLAVTTVFLGSAVTTIILKCIRLVVTTALVVSISLGMDLHFIMCAHMIRA